NCRLLEEKRKWDVESEIDGFRKEESCGASAAPIGCRKRKFIELSGRFLRLEREIAENKKLICLDDDDDRGGSSGDGERSNTEENKKVQIDEG
ncbi:hypothetical protein HN873_025393, partial [Arachis hypogaea]